MTLPQDLSDVYHPQTKGENGSEGQKRLSVESYQGLWSLGKSGQLKEIRNSIHRTKHFQKDGLCYCPVFHGPDQFLNHVLTD